MTATTYRTRLEEREQRRTWLEESSDRVGRNIAAGWKKHRTRLAVILAPGWKQRIELCWK